jgi:acetyltransferase-like isoleucine patch superfamily enzyme
VSIVKNIVKKLFYYYYLIRFNAFGENSKINPTASINNKNLISIGKNSFIGKWCHISIAEGSTLTIGNYVGISPYVKIIGGDRNLSIVGEYFMTVFDGQNKPIVIEDDVMVGMGAMILKGVTIGEGAVIGAKALVTRDILPYTVAVGNPAKMVKLRFSKKDIKTHMESIQSSHEYALLKQAYEELKLT